MAAPTDTPKTGISVIRFVCVLVALLGIVSIIASIALFSSDKFKKNEQLNKSTRTLLPVGLLIGGIVFMIVAGVTLKKYRYD